MVAAPGIHASRSQLTSQLIPLPLRRYVLRVRVDDTEYVYDATARLAQAQAHVLTAIREGAPAGGGAAMVAMEGALRTATRLAMPLLVRLVGGLRRLPAASVLLPELAPLPKHTDAMEHLARWIVEAVFTALGTGVYVLEPDEEGAYLDTATDLAVVPVRGLRWQHRVLDVRADEEAEVEDTDVADEAEEASP